jgi:hypothetical protein
MSINVKAGRCFSVFVKKVFVQIGWILTDGIRGANWTTPLTETFGDLHQE